MVMHMISFEQALVIAKEKMSRFNYCEDLEDVYIFGYDWGEPRYGGEGSPCVVYKKDGRAVNMPYYVMHGGKLGDNPKMIPVEEYVEEDN